MDKAEQEPKERVLDPKKITREAVDTILQEGIDFFIEYNNPNWFVRKGILPKVFKKERHFVINPIVTGTLIRISKIMADMEFVETINRDDFMTKGLDLMAKDSEQLIDIIAFAITNSEKKPSKGLIKFLKQNLTMDEVVQITTFVLKQMNVVDFMNSIILIKGMSLINQGG